MLSTIGQLLLKIQLATKISRNKNNYDIQVDNREIIFHPRYIQLTNKFLLE